MYKASLARQFFGSPFSSVGLITIFCLSCYLFINCIHFLPSYNAIAQESRNALVSDSPELDEISNATNSELHQL